MSKIIELSRKLLNDSTVNLIIGYSKDDYDKVKPTFITNSEKADVLFFDDSCTSNLMAYLHKPEVKAFSKIGIVVNMNGLRTYLQLIAENQFRNLVVLPIFVHSDGNPEVFFEASEIEKFVLNNYHKPGADELSKINVIMEMNTADRWEFWVDELKDCIKCYACRSVCPLCYCDKCSTDCNQPQWVATSAHALGNFEWHLMRAMHLGGRCINCNECAKACPMDIPLNLLTLRLNQDIENKFNQIPGLSTKTDYAFNTYKFEDKENFIR
jgi:ferredoxin